MGKKSCDLWPMVKGEPSKLYRDLLKTVGERPIANYIYAAYLQTGVAAQMNNAGYRVNPQGQYTAKDVYKFFDVGQMLTEAKISSDTAAKNLGVVDSNNNSVDFINAEDAFAKAQSLNSTSKGKVAYVVQRGDVFNVLVENKDSRTQSRVSDVDLQMTIWNTLKQELTAAGIDVTDFASFANDIVNPLKVDDFLRYMSSLKSVRNDNLSVRDIEMLLTIGKNTKPVQTLLGRWAGTTQEIAKRVYDVLQNPNNSTASLVTFVNNALTAAKTNNGFNVSGFEQLVNTHIKPNFSQTSQEASIAATLANLNKKYGIDPNIYVRNNDKIKKLSDAAIDAVFTLQRQIRNLEDQEGKSQQLLDTKDTLESLLREVEGKQYYAGLLDFLSQANKYTNIVDGMIKSVPTTGTKMEYVAARAKVLAKAKTLRDGYYNIVKALTEIDNLVIDESISTTDKDNLKAQADNVKKLLDTQEKVVSDLRDDVMLDISTEFLGDTTANGVPIANLLDMSKGDSSIMDYMYSIGRVSNPLIATMGEIVRTAQDSRDVKLNDISLRIRRATNKLYKAGFDTEFMYRGLEGHIISDIDWTSYNEARKKAYGSYRKSGLTGFALKDAMDAWTESATEEVVVDKTNGRTERIPVSAFRLQSNPIDYLAPAQKEYYYEMMQLKGEIGSLLPAYAQKQYIPAQIRKNKLDVIKACINGQLSAKKTAQLLLDKIKPFKIREDDAEYARNGLVINGEEYSSILSDFDSTPLKRIPVFYISRLKDQADLSHDFSSGLQELASTAINYEAMNNIKDVVEVMGDYISDQTIAAINNGTASADVVREGALIVAKMLHKKAASSNTSQIIQGFIDQHIYGEKMKDTAMWSRIVRGLIGYTSWKGLALNVPGAIANYLVGEVQMMFESGTGEFYNVGDYAWAHKTLFGDKTKRAPGELMDFLTNNINSKSLLLAEMFDPLQENYERKASKRYYKSAFRQLFGDFNSMALYGGGETIIHYVNMYALLHNQKVIKDGKEISLYDALETSKSADGNSELKVADGVVQLNGRAIDDAFLNDIRKKIRLINQNTHGSMNSEDKGIIHQRMLGRAVMNFRQWMVEHYSRRYRGLHYDASAGDLNQTAFFNKNKALVDGKKVRLYDAFEKVDNGLGDGSFTLVPKPNATTLTGAPITEEYITDLANKQKVETQWREGYWTTVGKFLREYVKDWNGFITTAQAKWGDLTVAQRYNIKRAAASMEVFALLFGLSFALGDPDEHKREWWRRLWIYETKRMMFEELASSPVGVITETEKVLQSPIASMSTVSGLMYPVLGLVNGDVGDTISRGRYKGWNKYGRNVLKYSVPFYNQIDQLSHMDTEDALYTIFDISNPIGR